MLQNIRKRLFVALTLITTVFMLNHLEARAWWSCMYPQESFENSVCAMVDKNGKRTEKTEMTRDDYEKIKATSRFKVRLYIGRK